MNVTSHTQLTDREFMEAFASCTLDPAVFTHAAHLRLAWLYVNNHGVDDAINIIRLQLQAYVKWAGAADKYNETVTVAAVKAVDHFMKRSIARTFEEFISRHPQLLTDFVAMIRSHYRVNIFADENAKRTFMEPDLQPF